MKIIGVAIAVLFTYFAMYLSANGAGVTMMGYFDTVSLFIVLGIPYGCTLAVYGNIIPDLKGLELMNKLFMPAGWLGTIIGWVMMFYGMGKAINIEQENLLEMFAFSFAVSIITLLYAFILKVVFTTLIASKK